MAACSNDVVDVQADDPPFLIDAEINPNAATLPSGTAKLIAKIIVTNQSDSAQPFSTRWLWLETSDGTPVRAYSDTSASQQVDFGSVRINPGDTLEMNVYWSLPGGQFDADDVSLAFARQ